MPSTIRPRTILLIGLACLLPVSCADRSRRNPLDPKASSPLSLVSGLQALAGDGQVELRWDFDAFDDIRRVRIFREEEDGPRLVHDRPAADTSFVDTDVVNGTIYSYRLSIDVEGEGELQIAGEPLATPGTERGWLADHGSGLVWRLTPDGRQGIFAQGRFSSISTIALDRVTGACWVADEDLPGLHRISAEGQLERVGAALAGAGELVIDAEFRRGWVVAVGAAEGQASVHGFDIDAATDTVELVEVDGTFSDPVSLAPTADGGLWISDRGDDRVLLFDGRGTRLREWRDLTGLVDLEAAASPCCSAWVLADDGDRLLRLSLEGPLQEVELPFAKARDLDVGGLSGEVWVAGDTDVAAYDQAGAAILHWTDVVAGRSIAIDEVNEGLWLASGSQLSKITLGGLTYRSRLTGFTSAIQVVVDPGR